MMIRVVTAAADCSILAGRMRRSLAGIGLIAALTACGGGGGDDEPAPEPEPPVPVATTLSGTVATGAPLVGATVQVTDATGATVCEQQTIADGTYTCTLAPTAQRPLLVRAAKDETVLYSATAASGDARANVTPLTHIIVSRLAPNGDAASLSSAIQLVTADALKAQADALLAALQPLLAALTQPSFDPLAGNLVANGTGQDKLLDTISVSVRPDGTGANIELTVKTIPVGSDPEPVSIQFRSNAASIPALPAEAVTAQTVAPVPAPSVVADLFARMTACYALPLSQRVNAPNDTAAVVGGPGDVIAPQCRSLFVNDDPATYLSGGNRVGRNAANEGSFSGLFRPGATGTVYQAYGVEYFRGNAEQDMVVSGYWQATNGQRANDVYVVRNVGGTLKLIGNQYVYPSAIRPFTEDREFLNTPQFSYYNTGYNVRVNNWTDGNGNPVFRKVLVTTPWNTQLTLLPAPGQALLAISQDGSTPTGTSILRLGAAYYNPGAVADPPWVKDPGAAVGTPMSEAELAALNNQGLWTFEFFFTDTSQPNVVQRNRTLSRPHTVAEIRQRQFANFTPAARANLIADSAATGTLVYTAPAVADIGTASGAAWTVPTNALEPTSVGVFGRAPFGSTTAGVSGNRYDDFASVASTARYTTVFCSAQSAADKHCDAGGQGRYAVGTSIYMLELWGLNDRQVEVSKKAALYKLQ